LVGSRISAAECIFFCALSPQTLAFPEPNVSNEGELSRRFAREDGA
jgi:hypothetical protein